MKRLLLVLVGAFVLVSCSKDTSQETASETQLVIKTAATNSNFGTYYGTFTSENDRYSGTVEIVAKPSLEGQALLTLNGDKTIELFAYSDSYTLDQYSELLFTNGDVTFLFSVEGNGINPLVQNCVINGTVITMMIKE